MALTDAQLLELRALLNELDDSNGWTDEALQLLAELHVKEDGTYNWNGMAHQGWARKAAKYLEMTRISESGSSRDLQQIFEHAMVLAKFYRDADSTEQTEVVLSPRSTKIVRAVREG